MMPVGSEAASPPLAEVNGGACGTPSAGEARSGGPRYIVGKAYDWTFFLLAPLLAVLLGALVARWPAAHATFWIGARRTTPTLLLLGALVHAHLFAVFARSHLDRAVFRAHPARFTLVPLITLGVMFSSDTAMILATLLVVFWDVYHSAMQTFGLARFYDRLEGNDPSRGRWLDLGLNLILYVGPILSGASLAAHLSKVELLADTPLSSLTHIPTLLLTAQPTGARWIWGATAAYLAFYVLAQVVLWRRGNVVSGPKVFLLVATGSCSLWVWATNPWGMAFFIMNLSHAVQYLALVWWRQRRVLVRTSERATAPDVSSDARPAPTRLAWLRGLVLFAVVLLAYGLVAEIVTDEQRFLWCLTQTVALMHFYYDGFIWSVRTGSALALSSSHSP